MERQNKKKKRWTKEHQESITSERDGEKGEHEPKSKRMPEIPRQDKKDKGVLMH